MPVWHYCLSTFRFKESLLVGMIEGHSFVWVYLDDKFCHTKSNRLKRNHEKQYNFNFNCNSIIISIVIQLWMLNMFSIQKQQWKFFKGWKVCLLGSRTLFNVKRLFHRNNNEVKHFFFPQNAQKTFNNTLHNMS